MLEHRGAVIGEGARSTVYEWQRDHAIKVPHPGTPETWADFEYRYTRAVAALGVRVPTHTEVVVLDGRRCTVSARIEARSMVDLLGQSPERAEGFGRQLAELQVALFAIVPSLELPRQVDRIAAKIRLAAPQLGIDPRSILEFLATSESETLVLCHGDLHPRNVLLAEDGPVLIDWFDACRGTPVAEVARSLTLFEQFDAIDVEVPLSVLDAVAAAGEAYRLAVTELLEIDTDALQRWQSVHRVARVAEGFALDLDRVQLADVATNG